MARPRIHEAALVVVSLAATACPQNFRAVEAAGEAGQRVSSHTVAFDASVEICLEAAALSGGASTACAAPRQKADRFKKLTSAIVAYATKLTELAKAKDVSASDELNSALAAASHAEWSSLESDANGAIAGFANAVAGVLSANYRAGVLDTTIRDVDPRLQAVVNAIDGEIALQSDQIESLKGGVDSLLSAMHTFASAKKKSPDRDQAAIDTDLIEASSASLEILKFALDRQRVAYGELRASLDAFGKAHATLAQHTGNLRADELLAQVTTVVKAAYATYHSVATPKPAGSAGGHS